MDESLSKEVLQVSFDDYVVNGNSNSLLVKVILPGARSFSVQGLKY